MVVVVEMEEVINKHAIYVHTSRVLFHRIVDLVVVSSPSSSSSSPSGRIPIFINYT